MDVRVASGGRAWVNLSVGVTSVWVQSVGESLGELHTVKLRVTLRSRCSIQARTSFVCWGSRSLHRARRRFPDCGG